MRASHCFVAVSVIVFSIAGCAQMRDGSNGGMGKNAMTFFIASAGSGNGGNLGGVAGADKICQSAAAAVGAGSQTWRAYLSTQATGGAPVIHARDRIGNGPWHNAKGVLVARDLEDLHTNPNINKETALTEAGAMVNGRGDEPNRHDILTGSQPDGRAFPADKDMTCNNWTSGSEGAAMVGHHDRQGLSEDPPAKSWNSSHASKGCSQEALRTTGGEGYLYCFANR